MKMRLFGNPLKRKALLKGRKTRRVTAYYAKFYPQDWASFMAKVDIRINAIQQEIGKSLMAFWKIL